MTGEWPVGDIMVDGIRLHYYWTGNGSKPPLVLCHGITDNGLCWSPIARVLEADYDIIMPDARGHGLSDAPEEGYSYPILAEDLAHIIRELDLAPARLLGHSMGAATVATLAARYPDLAHAVTLEDPPWREASSSSREDRLETGLTYREAIEAMHEASMEELLAGNRIERPTWSEEERACWVLSKHQVKPQVAQVIASSPQDWRELASQIRCQTLLITGDPELGAIVTPELAQEAMALLERGRVVDIPDLWHNIRRVVFDAYI